MLWAIAFALVHDFRRTAVRNSRRAGLSEKESMARSGHVTTSVFHRYAIISEADMHEAAAKVEVRLDLGLFEEKA
jgi:hypothetical protein